MASVDELRPFLEDPAVIERWRNLISATTLDSGCRIWTGAISSKGHGRFWVGQRTDGRDGPQRAGIGVILGAAKDYQLKVWRDFRTDDA